MKVKDMKKFSPILSSFNIIDFPKYRKQGLTDYFINKFYYSQAESIYQDFNKVNFEKESLNIINNVKIGINKRDKFILMKNLSFPLYDLIKKEIKRDKIILPFSLDKDYIKSNLFQTRIVYQESNSNSNSNWYQVTCKLYFDQNNFNYFVFERKESELDEKNFNWRLCYID